MGSSPTSFSDETPINEGFSDNPCEASPACLGRLLGAFAEKLTTAAPDLAAVLSAWETLPAPIKAGIVAMVKASAPVDGDKGK